MDIYEKIDRLLDSSGISRRQLAIKACIPRPRYKQHFHEKRVFHY